MGKIRPSTVLLCLLVLVVGIPAAQAQWNVGGNQVTGASSNQQEPLIVSDGAGGAIILYESVWSGTDSDLYIQRIDSMGVIQWNANGRAICTTDGLQTWADMVADGAGGAIMTWTGNGSIWIQKVNSASNIQWDIDGRFVNAGANSSRIVLDGSGGFFLGWEEWATYPTSIVVQRFTSGGWFSWPAYVTVGAQDNPRLVSDGAGGVLAGWQSDAGPANGNYVHGQRLDGSGVLLWPSAAVSPSFNNSFEAQIASDGAGGGIWTWDHSTGVVVQRMDGAGARQWGTDGVLAFPNVTAPLWAKLISDGAGGALVVCQDGEPGTDPDIYINRVLVDGTLAWGADAVVVCNAASFQMEPRLASDGNGGAYVVWWDGRGGATTLNDIYAQHIDANGNPQWAANGVPICAATGNQRYPEITATGTSSAIVTWEDDRNGISNIDIYAQAIHYDGSIGDLPFGVVAVSPLSDMIHVPLDENIRVAFNEAANPATFGNSTVVAHGSLTGLHEGAFSYNGTTHAVTLDPNDAFDYGEVVTVVLTDGVESAGGDPLTPYSWSFTTATNGVAGGFLAAESNAVQVRPLALCAGDLDGDNDMDLVAVNHDSDSFSFLRGNGDGTFAPAVNYGIGITPRGITVADVDRDGDLDVITAEYGSAQLSVVINNGSGGFSRPPTYAVGSSPTSVCAGDFDGDGYLDLATANLGDSMTVLSNNGDGTFGSPLLYVAGDAPTFITSGDLNGDGHVDLMTANFNSDDVSIFLNKGTGIFQPKVDIPVGDYAVTVHAADLDKDGDLDLVAAAALGNQMVVLFNNGDATFGTPVTYATGAAPYGGLPTDVDGDEDLDLIHGNANSGNIWVRLNDGSGSFGAETVYAVSTGPVALVSADFDEDGAMDLASANRYGDDVSVLLNHSSLSGVEVPEAPATTSLGPNVPNPFNPSTRIDYAVRQDGHVRLVIYDARGREIATLVDEFQTAQERSVTWDGRNESGGRVASGVYFYKLFAGDFEETRKMVLVK